MTDDRFERELRGLLAAREPAAVSPVLRARLRTVTAERQARAGVFARRLGGAWRAAVGVAAAVAVAVAVLAVLVRVDGSTIRDPGTVGGPSDVPGATALVFVTTPSDLFTSRAVTDADRRLAAVFAATGVEARFVVTPQPTGAQLLAPEGWPDGFDSDGDPDRDILAVIGIAPDGTPVCCLTLVGDLIERARADGYWRATDQPGALDADLAAPTAEFRDVALDRFVRGIEDLAPGIAAVEGEVVNRDDLARVIGLAAVLGPLSLLALVALRRRSRLAVDAVGSADSGVELLEVTSGAAMAAQAATVPAATSPLATSPVTSPVVPWQGDDGQPISASRWPAVPAWAVRSDRTWVLIGFAAIAGLALLGVVDLLLPARTEARLDPAVDGIGVVRTGLSILPLVLVGISLAGLIAYARQGRWRRRVGILGLVLVVGWTMSVVVDHTRPETPNMDTGWVAGDGGDVTWRGGNGLQEQVTYRLVPGEAFTFALKIGNPGVLPLTIRGLDEVRTSQPNPYVVSIVSAGWVVQPTDDGAISILSARPEDASVSWPVTLAPGDDLVIVILGRAGPCADPGGPPRGLPLTHIDVAYRVLGFERTTEVGLPAILSFPEKDPCTVQIPGGPVTYSTPGE